MKRQKPLILLMDICIAIGELWGLEAEETAAQFDEITIGHVLSYRTLSILNV